MSPQAPPRPGASGPGKQPPAPLTPEEVAAVLAVVKAAVEEEAAAGSSGGSEARDAWAAAGRKGAVDASRAAPPGPERGPGG